jgi:hypothetical protein
MRRNSMQEILFNSFLNYEILLILISMTRKFSITSFDTMKNPIVWIDFNDKNDKFNDLILMINFNYYFHESS